MKENGDQLINSKIQLDDLKYNYSIDLTNENQSASIILNKIKNDSRVLEFGPAIGNMTRYMKLSLNCRIDCVEIDPIAANIVKEFANKIIIDDLDSGNWFKELINERYDYIIFADVLEHLRYPKKALNLAEKLLKEDGEILISVPNIGHNAILLELMNDKFFYQKEGLLDETHIHFFTEKSLKKMIEDCGLHISEQHTTQLKPQETEFQVNFNNIPNEVTQYLKSRKNANTYQFIYLLKKQKNCFLSKTFVEKTKLNDLDYIQIYADQGVKFSEEHSSRIDLTVSQEFIKYKIKLPESFYGKLRLDIGNAASYFCINEIVLENIQTKEKNDCFIHNLESNEDIIRLENNSFLSIGNDPYFTLDYTLIKNQHYSLSIDILYIPAYTEIYKNSLRKYILNAQRLIIGKQDINEKLVQENNEYQDKIKKNQVDEVKMKEMIDNLEKEIESFENVEISLKNNIHQLEIAMKEIKESRWFRMKTYFDKIKKR